MFSLRDLRFVFCSRDLDVLRAQRIIGLFKFNYPQINEVGNPITCPATWLISTPSFS